MSNHPNRSNNDKAANPYPAEIIDERHIEGLTQTEAANMIYSTCRTWQQWEAGDRRMHPAFFELFKIKCETVRKATVNNNDNL
jgi:DNA-binding transcriptional regulator YiaG